MAYTITINIAQEIGSPNRFTIVERTCLNQSYWTESGNGEYVLNMQNSGTSGMLRFKDLPSGEEFTVIVGVHNYKHWCHIIPNFQELNKTAMLVHPTYYSGGERSGTNSGWTQLPSFEASNNLYATLSISV